MIRLKLKNSIEIRRTLSRVSNMVANGELDTKRANTIILACNTILSAIRTDEQQKKLEELEKMVEQLNLK